jgi:hypothetical protein
MRLGALPSKPPSDYPPLDPSLPPLPGNFALVSKRGGGKTTTCCRFIKGYGVFDPVYVFSPTIGSQRHLFSDYLGVPDSRLYEVTSSAQCRDKMKEAVEEVQGLLDRFKRDKAYRAAYQKLVSGRGELTPTEERMLVAADAQPPEGPPKKRPIPLMVLDDLQSLDRVMQSQWFTSLVLRHRHVGGGLSLCSIVQTLKGLGRAIRQNTSCYMLWGTHDESALADYAEECSALVPRDIFKGIFRDATQAPHDFLLIDLCARDKNRVFAKNGVSFYRITQ